MVAHRIAALAWSSATAAALAMCWAPIATQAQTALETASPALTLRELVDRAWERASRARSAEGRQHEAAVRGLEAESPFAGAPAVTLSSRDDRFAGSGIGAREHVATLSAPVWLPGQRVARGALAQADAALADATVWALRLALAGEVREQLWILAGAEAEVRLAASRAESSAALQADVQRRVEGGELARADALLAQQDALAAQALAQDAELRRNGAALRLELLIGVQPPQVLPEKTNASSIPLDSHPEIVVARLTRESAERRARLVNLSHRDPPEVGVGYRWDQPNASLPAGRTIGLLVRIPLAIDARNLPRQAAAQTELNAALAEERLTRERIVLAVRVAHAAVDTQHRVAALSIQRAKAAAEREALVGKAFEFGEERLVELLRARAAAREAESSAARNQAALGLALARLNQALGVLP